MTKSSVLTVLLISIVLAAIVVMTRLGFWQLHRAEEKQQRLDYIHQQNQSATLTLEEIAEMSNVQDLPISFSGELMPNKLLFWDNRVVNGVVGYEVFVPIKTSIGVLLTNWGWVQGSAYRDVLPEVSLPTVSLPDASFPKMNLQDGHQASDQMRFSGVVWSPSNNVFIHEEQVQQGWPKVIQQLDIKALQPSFDSHLLPFSVALSHTESHGFVNNYKPVVMPPEKHIAYAIQWFGLAIACAVVFVFASFKRGKS